MERQRIKLEVYQGLPIVQEMIKDLAITREMGETITWIGQRQFKRTIRNFTYSFTENDVAKLNAAIWRIGERLSVTTIEYKEDRQEVINQIKEKLSEVFLSFICTNKLQKSIHWWNNRLKSSEAKGTKASFLPEDIAKINLAVAEIATRLLSIELVIGES